MAFVTVSVDEDVDLDEIDTYELRQELESRGDETGATLQQGYCPIECKNTSQLAEALFEARRNGNDERALELVDRLIYAALGRII